MALFNFFQFASETNICKKIVFCQRILALLTLKNKLISMDFTAALNLFEEELKNFTT